MKTVMMEKRHLLGAVAIMFAALLWSLDSVFIRPKLYTVSANLVVFLEHALGLIVLSPFIIFNRQKIKALRIRDWGAILWVSLFGGLIGTIFITKAFFAAIGGEVTFATVVVLQKLQPIFALVLARIILGEKLNKKFYGWAILAILAAYTLAFGNLGLGVFDIDLMSNAAVFAILAAFAFGSSTVFGKRIVNHLDFKSATGLRFAVTSVMAFVLILFTNDIAGIKDLSGIHWLLLTIIVFSSGAFAMFVYYFGLKRISASSATIFELFWPFTAVVMDFFLNKNVLSWLEIVASIILLYAFVKVVEVAKIKPIEISASVVSGTGIGKKLGFPTINLDKLDIDIPYGIYLVDADIEGNKVKGLLHYGLKETFSNNLSLELYIKEQLDNIQNKKIKIIVIRKLRNIKKYKTAEELKQKIKEDIKILES